jgi:lipoyl(octanoyl) transferase
VLLDLGTLDYAAAYARQIELLEARQRGEVPDTLILVEHPHVITLGRRRDSQKNVVAAGRPRRRRPGRGHAAAGRDRRVDR